MRLTQLPAQLDLRVLGEAKAVGSGVTRDVPARGRDSRNFAIDYERFIAFLRTVR